MSQPGKTSEPRRNTGAADAPRHPVYLIDSPQRWARNPADLFGSATSFIALVLAAVIAVYGQQTTFAVTSDIRLATAGVLETLFLLPVNALEGLLSFFLPIALLIVLMVRRRWRAFATAILAGTASVAIAQLGVWIGEKWWPRSPLVDQFSDAVTQQSNVALVPYVALVSALLTVSSSAKVSRLTRVGWWLLGIVLVLSIMQGTQTLPAALITILIGTVFGQLARYVVGGAPERTTGTRLVALMRRAGIDVEEIVRIDDLPANARLRAYEIEASAPMGHQNMAGMEQLRALLEAAPNDGDAETQRLISEVEALSDVGTQTEVTDEQAEATAKAARERFPVTRASQVSRNYIVRDTAGEHYHVVLIDADRQILSILERLWARLTLKTAIRHIGATIGETAERLTLMSLQTEHLGLAHSRFVSVAATESSVAVVQTVDSDPLLSEFTGTISDDDVDRLLGDLRLAHDHGISHGNIHAKYVKVTAAGLKISSWQGASLLSSDTARQVDLAQAVAMLSIYVGVERTVAALDRCYPAGTAASVAPFLQSTILPKPTRDVLKEMGMLQRLRDSLTATVTTAATPQRVEFMRFSLATIVTVIIGVTAVAILLGSLNFEDLRAALSQANPAWMVGAFAAGLGTYLGAGIALKAYTPEHLPLGQSVLVQVAASVVTLVAPAGIGPAALNLRFLQKRKVATAPAIATVSIVQIGQFITTVGLLVVLSLFTGDFGSFSLPSASVNLVIVIALAVIGAAFGLPPIRNWILAKIRPTLQQIWPRLVWLATHPQRLLAGVAGAVVMSVAFIACFGMSLQSFGYSLPIVKLAVAYLISNSVGSVVPSPGGIGPVEAALTGGLVIAGVPYSVAFSTAVLYRLFTFWGRVPLGWVALQIAQKRGIV